MFTEQEVARVASLAKLKFSKEHLASFAEGFNQIIEFVDHLQEVDTSEVAPTYHGNQLVNVFREDIAVKNDKKEAFLANAPTAQDGFVQVPAIIESEETTA